MLAGTVVVAAVLGLSRWGTNLGIAPLFISDILIAFAVLHFFASRRIKGLPARDVTFKGSPVPMFVLFFVYFASRFVLSMGQAEPLLWLRDGVPFAYGALAFLSVAALARSSAATRAATFRVFRWALTFHLIWVAAVSFTGLQEGFDVLGSFGSAPAFAVRPDIDVALMSIAAALNLRQLVLGGRHRFWNIMGIALAMAVVFGAMSTRAGQLSFLIALAVAYILSYVASRDVKGRQLLLVTILPLLASALVFTLPATEAGQRLVATVAPASAEQNQVTLGAQGTQRARELTWARVVEWTNEDPSRALFGSGFGNDFLEESGTLIYLEGTTYSDVRSPHNWFVGVYARMGIIGLVLVSLWILQVLGIVWRNRVRIGRDDLGSFGAVTFVAILPVATLGVVLEAPFGAIPFFYAVGIIMAMRGRPRPAGAPFAQRHAQHANSAV